MKLNRPHPIDYSKHLSSELELVRYARMMQINVKILQNKASREELMLINCYGRWWRSLSEEKQKMLLEELGELVDKDVMQE